jgi:hypothetical protein
MCSWKRSDAARPGKADGPGYARGHRGAALHTATRPLDDEAIGLPAGALFPVSGRVFRNGRNYAGAPVAA